MHEFNISKSILLQHALDAPSFDLPLAGVAWIPLFFTVLILCFSKDSTLVLNNCYTLASNFIKNALLTLGKTTLRP